MKKFYTPNGGYSRCVLSLPFLYQENLTMKKISLLTVLSLSIIVFCCKISQPVNQTSDDIFSKSEITNYIDGHDVYVHEGSTVFQMKDVHVSGDTLYGKRGANPNEKDILHHPLQADIYSDGPIHAISNSAQEKIKLTKKEIRRIIFPGSLRPIEITKSGDDDTGIALGLIILIVILSILLLWLVIYLIVKASAQAANQATNSSSNGSGSNSNSGTSSGNGGGSSSGCYIATMVYGSYDAPQVMVLRKFRDEKLSRTAAGRSFIRWYYGWSPRFVLKYNHLNWLHKIIRVLLNFIVKLLS
jgi:uncharacterized membrane protein YgcG